MTSNSREPGSVDIPSVESAAVPGARSVRSLGRYVFPVVAVALSVVFLFKSILLGLGTLQNPGAGLWPFVIAIVTIVLAVVQAVLPDIPHAGAEAPADAERSGAGQKPRAEALLLGGMVLAYALLLPYVGYLLLTVALIICAAIFVAQAHWWRALITALVSTGLVYLVFSSFLGIPLPGWPPFLLS
jgi:putative tricarboxylic transport membrane protein